MVQEPARERLLRICVDVVLKYAANNLWKD